MYASFKIGLPQTFELLDEKPESLTVHVDQYSDVNADYSDNETDGLYAPGIVGIRHRSTVVVSVVVVGGGVVGAVVVGG